MMHMFPIFLPGKVEGCCCPPDNINDNSSFSVSGIDCDWTLCWIPDYHSGYNEKKNTVNVSIKVIATGKVLCTCHHNTAHIRLNAKKVTWSI